MVEYILLLAVASSLLFTVINSEPFQAIFGENGKFGAVYKKELEYTYRHGRLGKKKFTKPSYKSEVHESYSGKFFGAVDAYPKE